MQKSERTGTRHNLDDAFPPNPLETLLGKVIDILTEIKDALRRDEETKPND